MKAAINVIGYTGQIYLNKAAAKLLAFEQYDFVAIENDVELKSWVVKKDDAGKMLRGTGRNYTMLVFFDKKLAIQILTSFEMVNKAKFYLKPGVGDNWILSKFV